MLNYQLVLCAHPVTFISQVLGYARRNEGSWSYSPKTERTISMYQEKYSDIFNYISCFYFYSIFLHSLPSRLFSFTSISPRPCSMIIVTAIISISLSSIYLLFPFVPCICSFIHSTWSKHSKFVSMYLSPDFHRFLIFYQIVRLKCVKYRTCFLIAKSMCTFFISVVLVLNCLP